MRTVLILLALCVACDDEPTSEAPAAEAAETPANAPERETEEEPAEETTTGFIEAKVDGELKRFEYLPAHDNQVLTRVTHMQAHPRADSEEKLEITLLGWDVRQEELPMFFKFGLQRRGSGSDMLRSAQRMPGIRYADANGNVYNRMVNDDTLECQSLEDLVLSCTFSGTLEAEEGDGTVELTEGRAEVRLVTNELSDRFVEGTVGMAADESVERVGEAIDRRRGN